MPQQPISRYPEDYQLPSELSGRSSAPYRDIRNLNIPPTEKSGILIACFPRSLECLKLNSPFRDICKIISSLLWHPEDQISSLMSYPEDQQHPILISRRSVARLTRYPEYQYSVYPISLERKVGFTYVCFYVFVFWSFFIYVETEKLMFTTPPPLALTDKVWILQFKFILTKKNIDFFL